MENDGFIPDTNDGFVPDSSGMSGGMSASSPIDKFRQYMSTAGLGPKPNNVSSGVAQGVASIIPSPILRSLITSMFPPNTSGSQTLTQSSQADQLGTPDATVGDFGQFLIGPPAGKAAASEIDATGNAVKNNFTSLMDTLKAPQAAESLAPAEDALSAGLTAKAGQASELSQAKNTKNALYNAIPKDVKAPTPGLNTEAENILNEIKNLPESIQGKVKTLVSDYQEFGKKGAALGDIGVVRSHLGDIAANGEGVQKMYAARLGKALSQDVENFSNTAVLDNAKAISQGPSLEAQALRNKWVDAAKEQNNLVSPEITAPYRSPEMIAQNNPLFKLDNADIGQKTKIANSYFKDFSALQQHPITQALDRAKPAQMSQVIFKGGNIDDVNVAKAVLGKTYGNVSGQFYDQLVKSSNLESKLSKYSPEFLQAAIGSQRLQALQKLAQFRSLVSKVGTAGKIAAGAIGVGGAYEVGRKLIQ